MPKNKNKDWPSFKTLALILIVGFLLANFFIVPALAQEEGEDISELNTRIEEREREINILQKEIDAYAEQIKAKQAEAKGLRNQIAILDNQIAKVNLDIEATQARIEQTNLEIQKINLEITELEKQITGQKKKIAEYIRLIYKTDQVSYLEVILVNESFSDFSVVPGKQTIRFGLTTIKNFGEGIAETIIDERKTNGTFVYLTSLGLGLERKLTMRENIYLAGSIMGLEQKEIKQKFNQIVDFSGLSDFVDFKVYQFSTGMVSRLNFSITFFCIKHKNPEILLIDEVFGSGGDADFEEKASKKMEELIKGGATVVIASHDLQIIEKYCNKVLWLENGKALSYGESVETIKKYIKS